MRILHIADRLSQRGGAYVHLLGVLSDLAGGHDLRLAVDEGDGTALPPCPVESVSGLAAREAAPVDLGAVVGRFRPDLVHVHNVVNPAALAWAAEHGAVMTVHDHRFFCPGRGKWHLEGRLCRDTMRPELCATCFTDPGYAAEITELTTRRLEAVRRMRAIIVVSRYMRDELAAVGVPPERLHVIPPFVHGPGYLSPLAAPAEDTGSPRRDGSPSPEAASSSPASRDVLLFVGRLAAAKGVHDAVAAWRASGLDLPLVMAGTGPLRAELEAAGAQVTGWLERPALAGWYRRAAAVVMPSRWQEPFGIVGLEALTCGAPVAAWESGGVAEWHPGGAGLVPWGDVPALARALAKVAGRPVRPPAGFDRGTAMARLEAVYRACS